ncbi:hypothetical protein S1361_02420 [Streptomyces cyanogenus]|uniref:Uncharacterized protein n=1 Tax=Streptomyces cyanogenus TaxID=80860 RepID=A0ABX7TL08_STRCY|nr:hypothetical protein S1361_02420 [Streptomyces cyanogenus]
MARGSPGKDGPRLNGLRLLRETTWHQAARTGTEHA